MPRQDNLYLSISGNREIAGPVILSALYLLDTINSPYIQRQFDKVRGNWDNLWLDLCLDQLLNEEKVILITEKINCFRFQTNLPLSSLLRQKVDFLISQFYSLGVRNPHCFYYGVGLPASPREEGTRIIKSQHAPFGCFLSRLFSYSEYRSWMNFYHKLYPYYEWNQNFGLPRENHYKALFEQGPAFPIHRKESILNLGKYWLSRYKDFDWWAMTTDFPPQWWTSHFYGIPFLHFLKDEEREDIERNLFNLDYPQDFRDWYLRTLPPSILNVSSVKRLSSRRSSKDKILRSPLKSPKQVRDYLLKKRNNYDYLYSLL